MWSDQFSRWLLAAAIACVGCGGAAGGGAPGSGDGDGDGGGDEYMPPEPTPEPSAPPGADGGAAPDGGAAMGATAPAGAVAGERAAGAMETVTLAPNASAVWRVEAAAGEHTAFRLDFDPTETGVVMTALRWNGAAAVELARTNAGAGLRVLAVLDPDATRTYWVRVSAGARGATGALTTTRTPFPEGLRCAADCARLLQLPLPNGAREGYRLDGAVFRYQFGRRDLLMYLRAAGARMAQAGKAAFIPQDLSQWDGQTPGIDVGAPRHASHQRGKDVDVSLYGLDAIAPWRSYCQTTTGTVSTTTGRVCVPGTRTNFDGYQNAFYYSVFLSSGRVTNAFLDRELIGAVVPGARAASADGLVAPALVPLYGDGIRLQHWPNHDNHIHVRVSEAPIASPLELPAVFEAP